jgi:hypothetical protein
VAEDFKHPLAGRKQRPEHVAQRTAAVRDALARRSPEDRAATIAKIAATRAAWTQEQREARTQKWRQSFAASMKLKRDQSRVRAAAVVDRPVVVYGLFDPRDGALRYVGKTVAKLSGRLSRHLASARQGYRTHACNWLRSLLAVGLSPEIVEFECVPAGENWVDVEQFWIAYFRFIGCDLVNLCDGGQGSIGTVVSAETREKMRVKATGRRRSEQARLKSSIVSKAAWGRKPGSRWKPGQLERTLATKAARRAQGLYKKRAPHSAETRAKISATKRAQAQALADHNH